MAKAATTSAQAQTMPPAPADQDSIPLDDLARAVLDRSLRPRTAAVRRLAEGVLARAADAKKGKKKKSAASADKDGKKGGGKKRKLAKIPQAKK